MTGTRLEEQPTPFVLPKAGTAAPPANGRSHEFKSALNFNALAQKFPLGETEFRCQICGERGKGNARSPMRSVGGDFCWGLGTLLPPNSLFLIVPKAFGAFKAGLMDHLCLLLH